MAAQTSCFLDALRDTVDRLFKASTLLSKASTHDRYVKAEAKCNLQASATADIESIEEKVRVACGSAPPWLINRLGKANTKRRQFIAYSRASHGGLNGLSAAGRKAAASENPVKLTDKLESATASVNGSKSPFASTESTTTDQVDHNAFHEEFDNSRNYTTDQTLGDDDLFIGLGVPEIDSFTALGEEFICPLCCAVQRFDTQPSWR